MKKKKVNALVKLILTTPFLFALIIGNTSCGGDNGDDIENCDCTTTLHITGEDCCEGANCNCETVAGARVEGIAVTNRQDIEAGAFETQCDEIAEGLSWLTPAQLTAVKNNIKEIRVIPGPVTELPIINQDILTMEAGSAAADIWNVVKELEVSKNFDLAKEFHMAFHGNLNMLL